LNNTISMKTIIVFLLGSIIIGGAYAQVSTDPNKLPVSIIHNYPYAGTTSVKVITATQEPFTIAPNPFSDQCKLSYSLDSYDQITISVFDLNGKLIKNYPTMHQSPGQHEFVLSGSELPVSGVYLMKFQSLKGTWTKKISFQR